ncbi:LORF2 protein, partial [Crocuta crocuta]
GCGTRRTLILYWWKYKVVEPLWKTVWQFLTKLNTLFPYNPTTALLGSSVFVSIQESLMVCFSPCPPPFPPFFSPLFLRQVPPNPPIRAKKMWFIYTMEYYMAMRNNEIWPCVATWMDLEGVMLSEISQAEKDKYHMLGTVLNT